MEEKGNIVFRILNQILITFSIDILILMVLATLIGDGARSMSTIYQLGSKGLASATIVQFLLSSVTIVALRNFFLSEKLFKKLKTLQRTILMVIGILLTHIVYIILFGWFALDNYLAWISFLVLFAGGFTLGVLLMLLKIKLDNRQYDELLSQYKEMHEEEENE
jgi:hypothetical protein